MKLTVTGAGGLIGTRLVAALRERGDEVTVLSRSPERTAAALGVPAVAWDPAAGPAPAEAKISADARPAARPMRRSARIRAVPRPARMRSGHPKRQ